MPGSTTCRAERRSKRLPDLFIRLIITAKALISSALAALSRRRRHNSEPTTATVHLKVQRLWTIARQWVTPVGG
jgi:hypothetical protein